MTPSIGRIVHYRLPPRFEGDTAEVWRPAAIVDVFPSGDGHLLNLTVFLDGLNDTRHGGLAKDGRIDLHSPAIGSVGSAAEGTAHNEWRWPPRA